VKDIFGRYQSADVMHTLLASPEALGLGGEQRRITALFSDLRGFTALSTRLPPEQVVRLLNLYFEQMVEVCERHAGTVNEIVGDGLVVFFGAPLPNPGHARDALACALEMQLVMTEVNRRAAALDLPPLAMGIGLNTGEVVVGNVGSSRRAKYTAIGSEINLASRIESYTLGGQILVSPAVLTDAGEGVELGKSRLVYPKGVAEPVTLHEVLGLRSGDQVLRLPELEEAMRPLARPLPVRIQRCEGKHMEDDAVAGRLIALSRTTGLLETPPDQAPPALTNVRLELGPGAGGEGAWYAKVLAVAPEGVRVHFTEMAPETLAWLLAQG
jgi:adenylate cyclase